MSEDSKCSKNEIVISNSRELTIRRSTLIRRGLNLVSDLENQKLNLSAEIGRKYLVVDDDRYLREILKEFLESINPKNFVDNSISFGDYHGIINKISNGEIDIIISGINMPRMRGHELTMMMRKEGFNIPVILMTGYTPPERAIEVMRSGADDLLVKPFTKEDLILSIENVIRHREEDRPESNISGEFKYKDFSLSKKSNFTGLVKEDSGIGGLRAELNYKEGELHGMSRVYRKWGVPLAAINFSNGSADGGVWYSSSGVACRSDFNYG